MKREGFVENKGLKCEACGSEDIKRTFLGGSGKVVGILLICLSILMLLSGLMTGKFNASGLLWLIIGLASMITPKYQCKACKKKFS